MSNLYDVLGVGKDADTAEIRRAYRKRARTAHPDAEGGSRAKWERLQTALVVLGDARRRAKYDRTGEEDDGVADKMPAVIMQTAMQACMFVIGEAVKRGIPPEKVDIVADAKRHIGEAVAKNRAMHADVKTEIAEMVKLAKRFRAKKGKANRLGAMFASRANDQRTRLDQIDQEHEMYKGVLALLSEHSFDWERDEPQMGTWSQSGAFLGNRVFFG